MLIIYSIYCLEFDDAEKEFSMIFFIYLINPEVQNKCNNQDFVYPSSSNLEKLFELSNEIPKLILRSSFFYE